MFEIATRMKYRFSTNAGNLSTEDLWDLPLTSVKNVSLDSVARSLSRTLKEDQEESFVVKKSSACEVTETKLEIVKHIISVKLAERDRRQTAEAVKVEKVKLLNIIAEKEGEALKGESIDDLKKRLLDLEKLA